MTNGAGIMVLNSPGGSTLQWGAGRGSLYLSTFVPPCFLLFIQTVAAVSNRLHRGNTTYRDVSVWCVRRRVEMTFNAWLVETCNIAWSSRDLDLVVRQRRRHAQVLSLSTSRQHLDNNDSNKRKQANDKPILPSELSRGGSRQPF